MISRVFLASLLCWTSAAAMAAEAPSSIPQVVLNEFSGTVMSIDPESRLLRMQLEGGYNVEFTFDNKSVVLDGHNAIKWTQLQYGDKVTARYQGKELYAKEIVRTAKNPNAAPTDPEPALAETPEVHSVVSSSTASAPTP